MSKEAKTGRWVVVLSLLVLSPLAAYAGDPAGGNWPTFRGPQARGVADGFRLPTKWNAENSTNIKWKAPLPGLGHSSPVIWGDRVFITTAISGKENPRLKVGLYGNITPVDDLTVHRWRLYCIDKNSGKVLWERTVHEGVPTFKRHPKASQANSTPATDGRHVVSFYGPEGLCCYTVDGELLWKKTVGVLDSGYYKVPQAQWGFGSSPVIYENVVIVQCDVQRQSFVGAFNIKDGKEIWRTWRDEVPTWSTPTLHQSGEHTQVILNGYHHIGGYDAKSGKELWRLRGGGDIPVPTPIVSDDLIFITNAHGSMAPIYAIRTTAAGDITPAPDASSAADIAWSYDRRGNYMQTPLVYGDNLFCCRDNGVLTVFQAKTGTIRHQMRLGGGRTGFTASPVAGDGKVYFASEDGDIYVIKAEPGFDVLAVNPMGEVCMATPAISQGTIFFRTQHHLVAVK